MPVFNISLDQLLHNYALYFLFIIFKFNVMFNLYTNNYIEYSRSESSKFSKIPNLYLDKNCLKND